MTPLEMAWGWVPGVEVPSPRTQDGPVVDPRSALEQAILPALCRSPCLVSFSGGRDSSVVLALATSLARREGLPVPVPVTHVFADDPDAEEGEWQELVIRHLGLGEWVRQQMGEELDVVGPAAIGVLRRYGLLWPAMLHAHLPFLEAARGGAVISGEGGDEVLGPLRITPVTQALRAHPRLDARAVAILTTAVAPLPLRARALAWRQRRDPAPSWLRSPVLTAWRKMMVDDQLAVPLRWDQALRQVPWRRAGRTGLFDNLAALADDWDVAYHHPFLDLGFVEALARLGGWTGFLSRTEALRTLFADLLPDAILARTGKARFNAVVVASHSRDFVKRWNGEGVDPDLVDPEALVAEWRSPFPDARSLPLIQSAWLATQGPAAFPPQLSTGPGCRSAGSGPRPR